MSNLLNIILSTVHTSTECKSNINKVESTHSSLSNDSTDLDIESLDDIDHDLILNMDYHIDYYHSKRIASPYINPIDYNTVQNDDLTISPSSSRSISPNVSPSNTKQTKRNISINTNIKDDDINSNKYINYSPIYQIPHPIDKSTKPNRVILKKKFNVDNVFSKARHNHIDQIISIINDGFDVNSIDSSGNNLLHICAQNNLLDLAIILLEYRCNINLINNKGYSPFDYAELFKFASFASWLVSIGGKSSVSLLHVTNQ